MLISYCKDDIPACNDMSIIFEEALKLVMLEKSIQSMNKNVFAFGEVNGTKEQEIIEYENLNEFPKLILYIQGKKIKYLESYELGSIAEWFISKIDVVKFEIKYKKLFIF